MFRFLFLLLLVFAGWVWYQGFVTDYSDRPIQNKSSGYVSYGKETIDSLQANGYVTLDQTVVLGKLDVNGSLKAIDTTIGELSSAGYTSLEQSVVRGKSSISGFFTATRSELQGNLEATTQKITLRDTVLDSIAVKKASWVIGTQSIEIKGKSVIRGSIVFDTAGAKVYLSKESKIVGDVIGADVEQIP